MISSQSIGTGLQRRFNLSYPIFEVYPSGHIAVVGRTGFACPFQREDTGTASVPASDRGLVPNSDAPVMILFV